MKPWSIDVPVLLIFFVRDDTFSKVFESVRQARPRTLLLWQDGPRDNRPDDLVGIERCRVIAESIDWDCEVHRNYHTENMGCDPSTHYAHKWAFSIVDKCIVMEDDQVPDQSFYPFCKELLDRYENDERVNHICGYNCLTDATWCPNDYLFAYTGSGVWASWRRVAETWDSEYNCLDDSYNMRNLQSHYGKRSDYWLAYAQRHRNSGIAHWESILGLSEHLQSRYAIIPKVNLAQNCGISQNATHSTVDSLELIPKKDRVIYQQAQAMTFPLKHPTAVLPDSEYTERLAKLMNPGKGHQFCKQLEMLWIMIRNGRFEMLKKRIRAKMRG